MLKPNIKRSEGFTIIEVLIVLAIAGLILLIVFLAVPALQRNSRNTAMKNDVQNVLGGLGEFEAANNGSLPTGVTAASGKVTYAGTNETTIQIQGTTSVNSTGTMPSTTATVSLAIGKKCNGTATVANTRSVAALYLIETASGTVQQCTDS